MQVRKLRARANMILGAGIIALVLLPLVILYTPRASATLDPIVWETYIENMPFRYQAKNYYCAPASQEMVYAYYGTDIYQYYVAEVARTNVNGTGGWDILRAGHFSDLSSSIGDDEPWFNCSGYPGRDLGYASFYWSSPDNNFTEAVNYLYDFVDDGYPILVALWPDLTNYYVPEWLYLTGHCVVVVGYGSSTSMVLDPGTGQVILLVDRWLIVHDPWNSNVWGGVGGPNRTIRLDEFEETWTPYNCSMFFMHPFMVDVRGASVNATSNFVVTANVTYPCPSPFSRDAYPASNCTTTIDLPPSFSLAPGENPTKTVGPGGIMSAGSSSTISWNVTAPSEASSYEVGVEAEGNVSGMNWIGPPGMQPKPTYNYTDRIGGSGQDSVTVLEREPTENPAEITDEETQDSTGAPKTSFTLGETVLVSAEFSNVGAESQMMFIIVQLKDPDYRVLAPLYILMTLLPGQSLTPSMGFVIPLTGYTTGTWTARIMVFDAWPAQGGVPIGDPVTITFTVS